MSSSRSAGDISAVALVPAPRDAVFAFLADLENHWRVADRFVEVVELEGPPGARTGGRVRVRGPLGLRRTATTAVVATTPPESIRGSAEVGGTRANVCWTLEPIEGGTQVRLESSLVRSRPVDRVLLALGGRCWLRRRFRSTLKRLAERFA